MFFPVIFVIRIVQMLLVPPLTKPKIAGLENLSAVISLCCSESHAMLEKCNKTNPGCYATSDQLFLVGHLAKISHLLMGRLMVKRLPAAYPSHIWKQLWGMYCMGMFWDVKQLDQTIWLRHTPLQAVLALVVHPWSETGAHYEKVAQTETTHHILPHLERLLQSLDICGWCGPISMWFLSIEWWQNLPFDPETASTQSKRQSPQSHPAWPWSIKQRLLNLVVEDGALKEFIFKEVRFMPSPPIKIVSMFFFLACWFSL